MNEVNDLGCDEICRRVKRGGITLKEEDSIMRRWNKVIFLGVTCLVLAGCGKDRGR